LIADLSNPSGGLGSFPTFVPPELGALSARYESNGSPGAIGYDTTGGWSYGTYQLATIPGTFESFMNYLETSHADLAKPLDDAGGADDAMAGTKEFRAAWVQLANDKGPAFGQAQHDFIKSTHYDKQVAKIKQSFGIDVESRSRALQNVVWSMSVQHGNGTQVIFKKALKNFTANKVNDAELISLLYRERSKVDTYFASSTNAVKTSVKKRFEQEERDALRMLGEEAAASGSPDTANSCTQ
jgi:hypothetical protein